MSGILSPDLQASEIFDPALRPQSFSEFIGQKNLVQNLSVFLQAAKARIEAMDHVLFYGPPGLGKTTLASLVASALGVHFSSTTGPVLTKPGDLAAILSNLKPFDVLFIDEIHRLPTVVEEMLYSAMEDYKIDILIGEGVHAKSIQLSLSPFTLIGATTRSGLISAPLRDRFGILLPLSFYLPEEVAMILQNASEKMGIKIEADAAMEIASRCRGTPRIALRLLRRVRDFAQIQNLFPICLDLAQKALKQLGISEQGLDISDQRYLRLIFEQFEGGPVGLETLSAALSEAKDTIEDMIEPYFLQQGFLQKTSKGRMLTTEGRRVAKYLFCESL
jgi:holliday junction DNA helicase RuvB